MNKNRVNGHSDQISSEAAEPTNDGSAPPAPATGIPEPDANGMTAEVLPPEGYIYPSNLAPDDTYRIFKQEPPAPEIDRGFILAAAADGATDAEALVRAHHSAIFSAARGLRWTVLTEQERLRAGRVADREREARDLTRMLNGKRYDTIPAPEGATPWTWDDKIEVALLAITSIGAIATTATNNANMLHASGEAIFAHWWQAFAFVTVPVVGAVAFKAIGRLVGEQARRLYGLGLMVAGLVLFIGWMVGFSESFSGILTPVSERLADLAGLDAAPSASAGGGGHVSRWLIFCGGLGEAMLAAGAWICIALIAESHRREIKVESRAWTPVRRDLNRVLKHRHEEEALLGLVKGALARERAAHERFLGKAYAFLAAVVASHQQTRRMLEMQ